MKFFTNEVKIALVAIVGIVLLYFGLNFLKGTSVFSHNSTYYIKFADINGLTESCPIYAKGFQVGLVKEIQYDYSGKQGILVEFEADRALHIPYGSRAEIVSDIMGSVHMNLILPDNRQALLQPGDTIDGSINDGVTGAVGKLMPSIERVVPKMDSILASINMLTRDPALAHSLQNVETVSSNLTTTTASLNRLIASLNVSFPKVMDKAEVTLDRASTTFDNTAILTAKLAAVDIDGTMLKVNQTLANVQNFTDRLNSNEGTFGKLLNDPTFYNNLNSAVVNADSLVTNVKAHPKRYVHFSIFGRKSK